MKNMYSIRTIKRCILNSLIDGRNNCDVLNEYLKMKAYNEMGPEDYSAPRVPKIYDICINLLGNGVIERNDFGIQSLNEKDNLVVKLSPSCTLYIEAGDYWLHIKVNNSDLARLCVRHHTPGDLALWIVKQKQQINSYMEEWDSIFANAAKKLKEIKMSRLAIKAIFCESMKDYPHLEYEFVEQKTRMRIKVHLPNCKLGVYINAWWGSYKKQMPQQIEELKSLIAAHQNIKLDSYFIA